MAVDLVALNEALDELRVEIEGGCDNFLALDDDVAEANGLHRALLLRKFEENFGSPDDVVKRRAARVASVVNHRVLEIIIDSLAAVITLIRKGSIRLMVERRLSSRG